MNTSINVNYVQMKLYVIRKNKRFFLVFLLFNILTMSIYTNFIPEITSSKSIKILEANCYRLGDNKSSRIVFTNSSGKYQFYNGSTKLLKSYGDSLNGLKLENSDSNPQVTQQNHLDVDNDYIWVDDPTSKDVNNGYLISKNDSFIELNTSRGQRSRHWYNSTSGMYTYSSDRLVNKSGVVPDTDWITKDEYPTSFFIRLINGTIKFFKTVDSVSDYIKSIDNSSIWAVGIDSFSGITGFYFNSKEDDWAHGQYIYWPRLSNGQTTDYDQPIFMWFPHIYYKQDSKWYNQILTNKSLYTNDYQKPHNTLNFTITECWEISFSTLNIEIHENTFDFIHGIKYNVTEGEFHNINYIKCQDQDFEDVGLTYDITATLQAEGSPYQPVKYLVAGSTYQVTQDFSQIWKKSNLTNSDYSFIEIINRNDDSFRFDIKDMYKCGFTDTYLSINDTLMPGGITRKTFNLGMFNYGNYSRGNWIEIDPSWICYLDNWDLYRYQDSLGTDQFIIGENYMKVGGDWRSSPVERITWSAAFFSFHLGIVSKILTITSPSLQLHVQETTYESNEGIDGYIYNIGNDYDSRTAKENSQSYILGNNVYRENICDLSNTGWQLCDTSKINAMLDYWADYRDRYEIYICFHINSSTVASIWDQDDYALISESTSSYDPMLNFTYTTDAPETLLIDDGDTVFAGLEESSVKTYHSDVDGYDDLNVAELWIGVGGSVWDIWLRYDFSDEDVDVYSGDNYLISSPYCTREAGGDNDGSTGPGHYNLTWYFTLDWDYEKDGQDLDYRTRCDDSYLSDSNMASSTSDGQLFENEVFFYSFEMYGQSYPNGLRSQHSGTALIDGDWFKGGMEVGIVGDIGYYGDLNYCPNPGLTIEIVGNESPTDADGNTRSTVTSTSDGAFAITADSVNGWTTHSYVGIDNDYDFTIDISGNGFDMARNLRIPAPYYNCSRDNEPPSGTLEHNDFDSNFDGFHPQDNWDDDTIANYSLVGVNDPGIGLLANNPYRYRWDGSTYGSWVSSPTYDVPVSDGQSADADAEIQDDVGNIATIDGEDITVDLSVPMLGTVGFTNADLSPNWFDQGSTSTAILRIPFIESNLSAIIVTCVIDGSDRATDWMGGESPFDSSIDINGRTDGNYCVTLTIVNAAGNVNTTFTGVSYIGLDNTAPSDYIVIMQSGIIFSNITNDNTPLLIATINTSINETGVGLHSSPYLFSYRYNNGLWYHSGWQASSNFTTNQIPDSEDVDFRVQVRDKFGEVGILVYDENNTIDTAFPKLGTVDFTNEDFSPNWFDQGSTSIAILRIPFTESNLYALNVTCIIDGSSRASNWTGGGSPFDSQIDIFGLPDGNYSISIIIIDAAGNVNTTFTGISSIGLDNTAPSGYIVSMAPGVFFSDATNDLTPLLIATDNNSIHEAGIGLDSAPYNFSYRYNNSIWYYSGWQTANTYTTGLLPNSNDVDFAVQVRDRLGNIGILYFSNDNIIDDIDPILSAIYFTNEDVFPNWFDQGSTLTANLTILFNELNIYRIVVNCTVDGSDHASDWTGGESPFNSSITIIGLTDGSYNISITIFDVAGNFNTTNIIINLDNTAPTYSDVIQTNEKPTSNDSNTISINVSEPIGSIGVNTTLFHYRVDSGVWIKEDVTYTLNFTFESDSLNHGQIYDWYFWVNDSLGNSDQTPIYSFLVSDDPQNETSNETSSKENNSDISDKIPTFLFFLLMTIFNLVIPIFVLRRISRDLFGHKLEDFYQGADLPPTDAMDLPLPTESDWNNEI